MGFIEQELEKLGMALREPQADDRYCQNRPLAWASDPAEFAPLCGTVMRGRIAPLTDTLEGSEGYLALSHLPQS
jgi:hypothetical protein